MEASAVPRVAPTGVAALASPGLLRLLSDDRLVALIRDGNANAFEAVYDRHYRAILSFCRHMLGCADEAEDAVQHTFLAAYNDLVSSRKPIRLRAWLFTIARNRCLSILRAGRERTVVEFEEGATDGLAVQVQRRQDLRDLVVDINHLPDDQRAALVLAEIGAVSHDEIGYVLGVPKVKVKALIFQARESLLADRAARDADCREIRAQLATMRGAALRRTTLRRHLRECEGCREYRGELERQRRRIAVILPVAPTIALRQAVLGATAGGGLAGAGVAGGGLLGASSVLKGVAGKALIGALLAAAGTTGTLLAVHDFRLHVLDSRLPQARPLTTTGARGSRTGQLTPRTVSRPAPERAGASTTVSAAVGSSGITTTGFGHETARAIVHDVTGQLNNLLGPVFPHEKLLTGRGATPPRSTQTPISPPRGVAAPAPVPPTATPPTAATPIAPGSTGPADGSGKTSGPYAGPPTTGGPGPSGSSGSAGGSASIGTPVSIGAPSSASAGAGAGRTSIGPGGGTPATGTGASDAGPGPGPAPTSAPAPAPTPAPNPPPAPGPAGASGSGAGPGPSSSASLAPGLAPGPGAAPGPPAGARTPLGVAVGLGPPSGPGSPPGLAIGHSQVTAH